MLRGMGCFWEISTLPPSPPFLLVTATAPAADYRGRLMLTMQNSIEFIITKGRFPVPSPNNRFYTDCYPENQYIPISRVDLPRLEPAQYLRILHNQLPLLRLRTQATAYTPSHFHLNNNHANTPHDERCCLLCLPLQITANETHDLLHCPPLLSIRPTSNSKSYPQPTTIRFLGMGNLYRHSKSCYVARIHPTQT